jgi:REP element-mobilizing transposase RayT
VPRRAPFNPTGYYHLSTRGNFGEPLFRTPGEHELYLELYERSARKFGWTTFAWTLIWNHHHFVVRLSEDGLSEGMRTINHGFSRRMNAVYGRTGKGHLVRHAFFANEIDTHEYLLGALRYGALNAVKAGLCERPEDWQWCGYAATMGLIKPRRFHDVDATLRLFARHRDVARARYAQLVLNPFPGKGYDFAPTQRHMVRSAP